MVSALPSIAPGRHQLAQVLGPPLCISRPDRNCRIQTAKTERRCLLRTPAPINNQRKTGTPGVRKSCGKHRLASQSGSTTIRVFTSTPPKKMALPCPVKLIYTAQAVQRRGHLSSARLRQRFVQKPARTSFVVILQSNPTSHPSSAAAYHLHAEMKVDRVSCSTA